MAEISYPVVNESTENVKNSFIKSKEKIKKVAEKSLSYWIVRESLEKIARLDTVVASKELIRKALPYIAYGKVAGATFGFFFLKDISNGAWDNLPLYNFLKDLGLPGTYFGQLIGGYLTTLSSPPLLYRKNFIE